MAETQYTPPFTESFNLETPSMIDLDFLNQDQKQLLLQELEKRQNPSNASTSWTQEHISLLVKLRGQLNKNQTSSDYIPLKDRRMR